MLDLGQFKLQRAILEIRFDAAYLLWDRAGAISGSLQKLFPNLKVPSANPAQQRFKLNDNTQLSVELDKANIVSFFPPTNLDVFREAAGKVMPIIIDVLDRKTLTRIGFRVFYEKKFATKSEAAQYVVQCMPSLQRTGKHFNIEGEVRDPSFTLRWEGETTGCLVALQAVHAKLEVDVPSDWGEITPINEEKSYAQLDADMYAHSSTPTAKFNAPALIENWYKIVRRDVGGFLNG